MLLGGFFSTGSKLHPAPKNRKVHHDPKQQPSWKT